MTSSYIGNGVDPEAAAAALRMLFAYAPISAAPNVQSFLSYIVTEELAGRGNKIKAYSVAVDALGRPDSFNPGTDPSVRVLANRARNLLAGYYTGEGKDDPLYLVIPKGGYRPKFLVAPVDPELNPYAVPPPSPDHRPTSAAQSPAGAAQGISHRPLHDLLIWLVSAAFLAIVVGVSALLLRSWPGDTPPSQSGALNIPIVEIQPFEVVPETLDGSFTEGIREQLISDLSRFENIQVRALPRTTAEGTANTALPPAQYEIRGTTVKTNGSASITFTAIATQDQQVLWSQTLAVPSNDAEFQAFTLQALREIVTRIAAPGGIVQRDVLAQLEQRSKSLANPETSNYECVLIFYDFDVTKDPAKRVSARDCLSRIIATDSADSSIWAAWALMQYLDWSDTGESVDSPLLEGALVAASHAIQLEPQSATAHEYFGLILMTRGETGAAIDQYDTAIALNPSKPGLYVHHGWALAMGGDWDTGIQEVKRGIALAPAVPGWMRVPIAIDAFRTNDYRTSLNTSVLIARSGDRHGNILALAAAAMLDDTRLVETYRDLMLADPAFDPADPYRDVRLIFDEPTMNAKYNAALERVFPPPEQSISR